METAMKSTTSAPLETESSMPGVRMRTVVAVSFFIHLLVLAIVSNIGGLIEGDLKKKYISVELLRGSRGVNQSDRARARSVEHVEAKPQSNEKEASIPETSMSMTPSVVPLAPLATESIDTRTGPASGSATDGDGDYQTVHRISRLPIFRTQVNPAYPASERNAGKESRVVVKVYINKDGGVDDVKLIKSGGALFDEAVLRALRASFFEPGYMDGKQVSVRMQIPYVFKLR